MENDKYLDQLNDAYIESSSQFDKQLLYLASGALGLSFAFIKDIVTLNLAKHKWLLVTSWSLFGIVILLSVISHYTSLKAIKSKIENLHQKRDGQSKRIDSYTKLLNILMLILLSSALAMLTSFIGINI